MSETIIRVESLSKRYRLGMLHRKTNSFRDGVITFFKRHQTQRTDEIIWALRDISFEVKRGEVLGIIGPNGAGKSTLLKILSRITTPTSGEAFIDGRVGSLLEVGTGFHPELTGRENIYLNGAILGMKKAEIKERFDEIVAFAEIEKFLGTPVKRYSSGMYVRLAFAVAAHLQPEILLVDEVLAVGDISFQKKCLSKMEDVAKGGRTVLFVSHNMSAINSLCQKVMLIDDGCVAKLGYKENVIQRYLEMISRTANIPIGERRDRKGNGRLRFIEFFLENGEGERIPILRSGQEAIIGVRYKSSYSESLKNISVAFALHDNLGNRFTDLASRVVGEDWNTLPAEGVIRCHIQKLPLAPGSYTFNVFASVNGMVADLVMQAGKFNVEIGDFFKSGRSIDKGQGFILINHYWTSEPDA